MVDRPLNVPVKPRDLPAFIDKLKQSRFYGEVAIRFRNGEPTSLVLNETFLIENPSIGGNRNHEHTR